MKEGKDRISHVAENISMNRNENETLRVNGRLVYFLIDCVRVHCSKEVARHGRMLC